MRHGPNVYDYANAHYHWGLVCYQGGAGATEPIITENAYQLYLQLTSLAQLTYIAGVSQTLYTSVVTQHNNSCSYPCFNALSGSLGCLCVGGTLLFDASRSLNSTDTLSKIFAGGVSMVLFGLYWV